MIDVKHISKVREKTLDIIKKRKSGEISSLRTPWKKLNTALLNGFDWKSIVTLAGESGVGKTTIADQIINEIKEHNPGIDTITLKFQMEMTDEQTGARELSGATGLSLKQLYSAEEDFKLTEAHIKLIEEFHKSRSNDSVYQTSEALTVAQMKSTIVQFFNTHKKPMIVYMDHSILIRKGADESNQLESLQNLCNMFVEIKKQIPVIFIILSQTNRSLDDVTRKQNGKIENYPVKSDIFGSDSLYQASDVVIVFRRPRLLGITQYGPEKYRVGPEHIVAHVLKSRYDQQSILFFKEDFKHFKLEETNPPQTS
jgi:replicative DNA helicase